MTPLSPVSYYQDLKYHLPKIRAAPILLVATGQKGMNDMNGERQKLSAIWTAFYCLCTYICLSASPWQAFADSPPKVLILNSYHQGFEWTDDQVSAARKVLYGHYANVEIFVEYMDTKRQYNEEYLDALYKLYALKYPKIHLDAVITTDDNALWFALEYRRELFNDAPISFCGINNYKKALIESQPNVTGVVEVLDIGPTIDLALSLHPAAHRVVVIADNTPTGAGQLNAIKKAAKHYPQLEFEYLEGAALSHQELLNRLAELNQESIALLAVWLRDKNGKYIPVSVGGPQISSLSGAPVYGIVDLYLGWGILGGKLLNSEMHGRIAAEKAVNLISGNRKARLPVIQDSTNPYMFDFVQLERWNIKPKSLPEGGIIINRRYSFFQRFEGPILTVFGIIVLLTAAVAVLSFNIRTRIAAESELKKSEEKFRNIFQNHSAVKLLIDPETGSIVEANNAAETFYGWPLSRLSTMKIHDINVLSDGQVFEEMEKAKSDQCVHFNFRHCLADGSTRDVEVFSSKVEVKDKSLLHSIIHDVTDRKNMERALRESEDKFRNIFELSPQAIALTEMESGRIVDVNSKLCEFSKRDKKELIGAVTTELGFYSLEDRERFVKELEHKSSVNSFEMSFTAKDGSKKTALMFARRMTIAGRQLLLTTFLDITGQREMEERLLIAQKNESIGSLAGGIAHDFNNILFPIMGLSEILVEDLPQGSPEQENAQEIFNAAIRGREVVRQILTFSRQAEPKKMAVKIQRTIKEAVKLGRSTIPSYIEIESSIDEECCTVMANATQIHQVAVNLITNAYHAIDPNPGKIIVEFSEVMLREDSFPGQELPPGAYARISVKDTGTGIAPSDRDKIFQPYFTTKEQGKGTGLGLAVVYGIVKNHQGEIRVQSEPGKGSEFTVYLPLVEKDETQDAACELKNGYSGKESILLVDDELSIARLEKNMLERLGYRVTSSTGSREALEIFQASPNQYDLVISDMNMPNMTGDLFAQKVREIKQDVPVIICTGFSARINQAKAEAAGIKGFLMKPIVKAEMAKMVRKVLDEAVG